MLVIVDIGIGNVNSVSRALTYLKIKNKVSADPQEIKDAGKIVFPGVGNFAEASRRLEQSGLMALLREQLTCKPVLGICLGMQLLASAGDEGGGAPGLGWIEGRVSLLDSAKAGLRLPHVGWNDVETAGFPVFENIPEKSCFYFTHSYAMNVTDSQTRVGKTEYGVFFPSVVQKGNVIGVQFHPEKSQKPGLQLLKNFSEGRF